jgi:hypothetical protein
MIKFARMAALAAAATLVVAPAVAAPVGIVPPAAPVTATARIVKPLTLERVGDMDFGQIVVQDAGTATMTTAGAVSCTANLTCSGTTTAARYLVKGTNNQVVTVTAPDVSLTNAADSLTPLTLDLTNTTSLTISNSGQAGTALDLGGSIAIPANVRDGVYTGTLNVTVEY